MPAVLLTGGRPEALDEVGHGPLTNSMTALAVTK